MPVHHRLRFLTFPMRTSRLCSLWPDMRALRFRRVPFGRDVAFDPGGATASRIAMPRMLPSTVPSVSASARLLLSWLNPPPHPITVSASPDAPELEVRIHLPPAVSPANFDVARSGDGYPQIGRGFQRLKFRAES